MTPPASTVKIARPAWKKETPLFKGKRGDVFLIEIKRFAEYHENKLDDGPGRDLVKYYVKAKYYDALIEMEKFATGSWNEFEVEFRETFPQAFKRSFIKELKKCKQGKRTILSYNAEFNRIRKRVKATSGNCLTESEVADLYIGNMERHFRNKLMGALENYGTRTFDSVFAIGKKLEKTF